LDAVISDCGRIIKLANSINREDIVEQYHKILNDTQTKIEKRKAEEALKAIEEKKTVDLGISQKDVILTNYLIILCIIGGLLIIISAILDIILLATTIYANIIVDIRILTIRLETRETFFIFLFINGCICIFSGILTIIGSIRLLQNRVLDGRSMIIHGLFIVLFSAPSLLIVGAWAGSLSESYADLIILNVFLYFIICLIGVVIVNIVLWMIKGIMVI